MKSGCTAAGGTASGNYTKTLQTRHAKLSQELAKGKIPHSGESRSSRSCSGRWWFPLADRAVDADNGGMSTHPCGRSPLLFRVGGFLLAGLIAVPAGEADVPPPRPLPRIQVSADQRGFATEAGAPFVPFGVTYFRPGTGWPPQVWKQFDAEATRKGLCPAPRVGRQLCPRVSLVRVVLRATGPALAGGPRQIRPVSSPRRGSGPVRPAHRARPLGRHAGMGARRPAGGRKRAGGPGTILASVCDALPRAAEHLGVRIAERAGSGLGQLGDAAAMAGLAGETIWRRGQVGRGLGNPSRPDRVRFSVGAGQRRIPRERPCTIINSSARTSPTSGPGGRWRQSNRRIPRPW